MNREDHLRASGHFFILSGCEGEIRERALNLRFFPARTHFYGEQRKDDDQPQLLAGVVFPQWRFTPIRAVADNRSFSQNSEMSVGSYFAVSNVRLVAYL